MHFSRARVVTALSLLSLTNALNIIVNNDDGFGSANIREFYRLLKAAGHDAWIVAPVDNESGKGGTEVFTTEPKLTRPSEYGIVPAGAPSFGTDPHGKGSPICTCPCYYRAASRNAAMYELMLSRPVCRLPHLVLQRYTCNVHLLRSRLRGAQIHKLDKGGPLSVWPQFWRQLGLITVHLFRHHWRYVGHLHLEH